MATHTIPDQTFCMIMKQVRDFEAQMASETDEDIKTMYKEGIVALKACAKTEEGRAAYRATLPTTPTKANDTDKFDKLASMWTQDYSSRIRPYEITINEVKEFDAELRAKYNADPKAANENLRKIVADMMKMKGDCHLTAVERYLIVRLAYGSPEDNFVTAMQIITYPADRRMLAHNVNIASGHDIYKQIAPNLHLLAEPLLPNIDEFKKINSATLRPLLSIHEASMVGAGPQKMIGTNPFKPTSGINIDKINALLASPLLSSPEIFGSGFIGVTTMNGQHGVVTDDIEVAFNGLSQKIDFLYQRFRRAGFSMLSENGYNNSSRGGKGRGGRGHHNGHQNVHQQQQPPQYQHQQQPQQHHQPQQLQQPQQHHQPQQQPQPRQQPQHQAQQQQAGNF